MQTGELQVEVEMSPSEQTHDEEAAKVNQDGESEMLPVQETEQLNREAVSEELDEEETRELTIGLVRKVARQQVHRVEIQEVTTQTEPIRRVDHEYTVRSPSSSNSLDSFLHSPSLQADKHQSKWRKRSDFEDDEVESSQGLISEMSKKIKLLKDEISKMLETQMKMKREMESLIKKNVKKATKPAIKKLGEVAFKFKKAVGDQEKVQRMVNLQRV